jgi:hypothetical protein
VISARTAWRLGLATAALAAVSSASLAQSSNTGTTRSFTSEWQCDNGRSLFFNAHPRRPREEAHIRYVGSRIEVRLQGPVKDGRYVGQDGKVVWQINGNEATFSFEGLLPQPITCTRVVTPPVKK